MAEIKKKYTAVIQSMIYALIHTVIQCYTVNLLYTGYYLFEMRYIFVLPGWCTALNTNIIMESSLLCYVFFAMFSFGSMYGKIF